MTKAKQWFLGLMLGAAILGAAVPVQAVPARIVPAATVLLIDQGNEAITVTGTTSETTLATIYIPANIIGPNGMLRVTTIWSYTSSANTKTFRYRLGNSVFFGPTATATSSAQFQGAIRNRNSSAVQVSVHSSVSSFGTANAATPTYAIDTTIEQALTITGTLTLGTESITLEAYTIEVLRP